MPGTDIVESDTFEAAAEQTTEGVVRGAKLLGLRSRNGRSYDTPGVRKAAPGLLIGARIFIDHPDDPTKPRSYRDAFGVVESCDYVAGKGHFGQIKYNPKHPLAEQFAWDVKNNPSGLGMSVNARVIYAPKKDRNGDEVVESLELVRSLDIVTKPATSVGVFEHEEEFPMDLKTLREQHADIVEQIENDALAKAAKATGDDTVSKTVAELQSRLKDATEQLLAIHAADEARKVRDAVEQEFSKLVLDEKLSKSVVECACEMAADVRPKFKGIVEELARQLAADTGVETEESEDDDSVVDADEQEEPVERKYVPRRGATSNGSGKSLREALGFAKK